MTIFTTDDMGDRSLLETEQNPGTVEAFKSAWKNRDLGLFGMAANYIANKSDPGQMLTQEDAVKQAKAQGAHDLEEKIPKEGIGSNALYSMIQENYNEKKRSALASMATSSVGNFFGNLAGSFADPVGAAATFIPFVGEARYTAVLEGMAGEGAISKLAGPLTQKAYQTALEGEIGLGKTLLAKGGVGVAQGVLGTAALEPATSYLSNQLGKDYNLANSFENLAFGGMMGGGLHMLTYGMGRGISKILSGFSDGERADIMRGAVGNLLEDKQVSIAPAIEGYEAQKMSTPGEDLSSFGNEKKSELAQVGAEKPGTSFLNPEATRDVQTSLSEAPKEGGEMSIPEREAKDLEQDFNAKAKVMEMEPSKEMLKADEDLKATDERNKALRILTNCAQRGEG